MPNHNDKWKLMKMQFHKKISKYNNAKTITNKIRQNQWLFNEFFLHLFGLGHGWMEGYRDASS